MKLFYDIWLMFKRNMQITYRNPVWLIIGLFQPLCFLLLFAPLLEKLTAAPGFPAGGSLAVFTPGLLVMMAMYGTSFVGFGLIDDIRSGVIERFRVTPVSRIALLLGRCLRDVLMLVVQASLLLTLAAIMGLKASLAGMAISFIFVILIGLSMSAASYAVAMTLKSEDALAPVINFFLLPLQLLSGITLPLALAPNWIAHIAYFNPLSHAVHATRALFMGSLSDPSVILGLCVMIVMALGSLTWAGRLFRTNVE